MHASKRVTSAREPDDASHISLLGMELLELLGLDLIADTQEHHEPSNVALSPIFGKTEGKEPVSQ